MTSFQHKQLGKYRFINKIGVGSMAEVYIAKVIGDKGFKKLL
jgi:hypothetical protein